MANIHPRRFIRTRLKPPVDAALRSLNSLFGPKSVYFFALHRGGSTLMANMLGEARRLHHVNYESMIFSGDRPDIIFHNRGHLYGSIRLTQQADVGEAGANLRGFEIAKGAGFLKGRNAVAMVRDPRDMLVSRYYYFGWNHPLSADPATRSAQEEQKRRIQAQSIDEYVVANASGQGEAFKEVERVLSEAHRSQLLRYEDMIFNFEKFSRDLKSMISFPSETIDRLYRDSRPNETEVLGAHKRSGQPGSYKDHLSPTSIDRLNEILQAPLSRFGYL